MRPQNHEVRLQGCSPTPLAHYLKALGILRLVAEQTDPNAVGWWKDDTFYLRSKLDQFALTEFFLTAYEPTPVVVPWSGSDFFKADRNPDPSKFNARWPESSAKDRPKGETVIDAFLVCNGDRVRKYRAMIELTFQAMQLSGVEVKDDLDSTKGKKKPLLLATLRNIVPDHMLPWIDVTSVVIDLGQQEIALNCLLGGGGGSDGNAHFSDNFMQCVWIVLDDFACQKKGDIAAVGPMPFSSPNAILESLFATQCPGTQIKDLSPALFNPEAVGGANATVGFIADSASNPWNYILMIEGSMMLAGAASRRFSSKFSKETAFPFSVDVVPVGNGSLASSEKNPMAREFWLPLWDKPMSFAESMFLFSEARISIGKRSAKNGVDVARSIASLGVDRGISQFQRIAFLRGRIGGDNYFTACNAGRFRVKANPRVEELLTPLDSWLDRFRRSATGKNAPARAGRSLRQLESSILRLCQRGDSSDVQSVLIALGEAEATVAISKQLRDGEMGNGIGPIPLLSPEWLIKAYDGSREFRLAAALASVSHDSVGPFRRHLEPIDELSWKSNFPKWSKEANDPAIVWGSGDLVRNLCAVLSRRLIDVFNSGKDQTDSSLLAPLRGRCCASLSDVAAFIDGHVDDSRLDQLIKALMLIGYPAIKDHKDQDSLLRKHAIDLASAIELNEADASMLNFLSSYLPYNATDHCTHATETQPDAAYSLLKLCHLPHKLFETAIVLVPQISRRAIAGDGVEATRLASRRLVASGFETAVKSVPVNARRTIRTAASLLFPISERDSKILARRVLRKAKASAEIEKTEESIA